MTRLDRPKVLSGGSDAVCRPAVIVAAEPARERQVEHTLPANPSIRRQIEKAIPVNHGMAPFWMSLKSHT